MKKRANLCKQVKHYLTKVLNMDTLETLGIIATFILLHVLAIVIISAIVSALGNKATPMQYKQSILTMNSVQRTKSGDLAFYHTHNETGVRYVRVGIQWKNVRTGKLVSKKSIGL